MKININHEELGEIVYEENFWTGRKKVSLNGRELQKTGKKSFVTETGESVEIQGSYLSGALLQKGDASVRLTPPVKWYEIAMSILPFILVMIWGNVVALCEIIPVVGGAIGGGISGLFSVLNLLIIKGVRNVWLKIVISLLTVGIVFGICCGIGYALVAAIS